MLKKVRNSKAKALRYVDERVAEVSSCRTAELPKMAQSVKCLRKKDLICLNAVRIGRQTMMK